MSKKISVVIPVYNVEKYLSRCLESVVSQTYTDLEIILANDGSTDSSPAICDEWAKKDNRIKVIHGKNVGAAAVRNNAFKYVSGDYLAFVDSDDRIEPTAFEKAAKILESENVNIAVFGAVYHYVNGAGEVTASIEHIPGNEKDFFNADEALQSVLYNDYLVGDGFIWNKVFRISAMKERFGKIPEFFTEIYEDKTWVLRMLCSLGGAAVIKEALYNYYVLPGSLSHNSANELKRLLAGVEVFAQIMKEYEQKSEAVQTATKVHYYLKTSQSLLRAVKLRNFKTARVLAKAMKGHKNIVLKSDKIDESNKKRFKASLIFAAIFGL